MEVVRALQQSLFLFNCPEIYFSAAAQYAQSVPWDQVSKRGNGSNAGRSYIHPSASLQGVDELGPLHQWIEERIEETRVAIGWRDETVRGLRISQSWLNRSDIGEMHHRHHHPLSILSAILYITEPATTTFFVPSIYALPRVLAPDKKSGQMEVQYDFVAGAAQLVVFPSTLKHGVGPNLEPRARITLSVNTWFTGSVGRVEELAYIGELKS